MWRRRLAVTALVSLLAAVVAGGALAAPSVTGVRVGQYADMTRLVLDLTESREFRVFTVSGPPRVVIDLATVRWALAERTLVIGQAGVAQVRFGQFDPDTSRIVLDLTRPATVRQAQLLELGADAPTAHRLIVDLVPASVPAPRDAAPPDDETQPMRRTAEAEPPPLPRLKPPPTPVRRLIAIDPGHGGRDPGAISASGLNEKTLTLTFARELRTVLESSGRYGVVMTRDSDRKVRLYRRVEIAREANADLFLSIHVDRLDDRRVRGASVYTLSDEASDEETAELTARENKADIVAGVDLSEGYDEDVAKVLIALVQQDTMNCAAALAARLLSEIDRVAPLVGRSHRFGDFRVLKAPDIPSVLIELGFLSNDQDAARLTRRSHRAALAESILEALDSYFGTPC